MSNNSLVVKVVSYEDQAVSSDVLTSPGSSNVVTLYVVKIEATLDEKTKAVYFLRKRYSDFSSLYVSIKDKYGKQFENYKFPNKSMLNTSSQFTKERRQKGFDELMHVCVSLKPLPLLVSDFFEFNHHLGENSIKFTSHGTTQNTNNPSPSPFPTFRNNSNNSKLNNRNNNSSSNSNSGSVNNNESLSDTQSAAMVTPNQQISKRVKVASHVNSTSVTGSTNNVNNITTESSLNSASSRNTQTNTSTNRKEEIIRIFPSTCGITIASYAFCVALGIIDVSLTNKVEVVLTISSLVVFFIMLRIFLFNSESLNEKKSN